MQYSGCCKQAFSRSSRACLWSLDSTWPARHGLLCWSSGCIFSQRLPPVKAQYGSATIEAKLCLSISPCDSTRQRITSMHIQKPEEKEGRGSEHAGLQSQFFSSRFCQRDVACILRSGSAGTARTMLATVLAHSLLHRVFRMWRTTRSQGHPPRSPVSTPVQYDRKLVRAHVVVHV